MRKFLAVAILLFASLGNDAQAQSCPGQQGWVFADVLASDPFCTYLTWLANRNVTEGCAVVDASNRLYCPADLATRTTVAAFVARLGEQAFLQGGNVFPPGVTNAVLGTTDQRQLDLWAGGSAVMQFIPHPQSPIIVGGRGSTGGGDAGVTISGGGRSATNCRNLVSGTDDGWCENFAQGEYTTIGGGMANMVENAYATIGGGENNRGRNHWTTIGGGYRNLAGAYRSPFVGGDYASVGGGKENTAGGTAAVVPGGEGNVADGSHSFASGFRAHAVHDGSHVFADGDTSAGPAASQGPNTFFVAAAGGIVLANDRAQSSGCTIVAGNLACTGTVSGSNIAVPSDRNRKTGVAPIAPVEILDRVAKLPIATWEYTTAPGIRHVGPMAQDFRVAFGLGDSDTTIGVVDASGIALAAIQGLNMKLEQELRARDAEIAAQREEIASQRAAIAELRADRAAIATLKAAMVELLRERGAGVVPASVRH